MITKLKVIMMLKLLIDDILNYPEGALIVYHFQSIKEANSFRSRMYKLKSEHPKGNNITM